MSGSKKGNGGKEDLERRRENGKEDRLRRVDLNGEDVKKYKQRTSEKLD